MKKAKELTKKDKQFKHSNFFSTLRLSLAIYPVEYTYLVVVIKSSLEINK